MDRWNTWLPMLALIAAPIGLPATAAAAASSPAGQPVDPAADQFVVRKQAAGFRAESGRRALEVGPELQLRVFRRNENRWVTLSPAEHLPPGFSVRVDAREIRFQLAGEPAIEPAQSSAFGPVDRLVVPAASQDRRLTLRLMFDFPRRHPDAILAQARFTNAGANRIELADVCLAALRLQAPPPTDGRPFFWSFNGAGIFECKDWVLPVRAGFSHHNDNFPLGGELGGGTPFLDLWRPEMGVAIAAVTPTPILAKVPVSANDRGDTDLRVQLTSPLALAPGAAHLAPPVMIVAHQGDFHDPVVRFRELLGDLGVRADTRYQADDYRPTWGTWAFQRLFTVDSLIAQMGRMKRYGLGEMILDDGWYDRFGDWQPDRKKFPRGDADVRAFVDKLHKEKITLRLWWTPGVADLDSVLGQTHADWFIHDKNGAPAKASWTAYFLCPAHPPVRAEMARLINRFIRDYDVDSFKLDGPCLNAAPLCHNKAHGHARPEESFEQWPGLMAFVQTEAKKLKPNFRVELCPCGLSPSLHVFAGLGQPVTSDPWDRQVTVRTKFLKAATHPSSPVIEEYCGFGPGSRIGLELAPRAIGTGAVYGTMHPWMGVAQNRWVSIYNRHRPAEGEYLNLYNLRWEPTEGHAIRKGDRMYYGFYTNTPDDDYVGPVQLRGLAPRRYRVTDYAKGKVLGEVTGPVAELQTYFHDSLLLVAEPLPDPDTE